MTRNEIWVFIERVPQEIEDVSLEILGKATDLSRSSGYSVTGVLMGTPEKEVIDEVMKYGADRVLVLKHPSLNEYSTELFVKSLFDVISNDPPQAFLIGATYYGRDLAGRLAARLRTGLTANAVNLEMDAGGLLVFGVPAYGGKILAEIVCEKTRPQMSTVRPGTFTKVYDPTRNGRVDEITPDLSGVHKRVKIIERKVTKVKDLTRSERTVIAGNGTGGNISLVRKLADLIGSDVGVTRPLADRGIAPRELQVGSTGYSLKSKFALVLGVSGSEHFTPGIRDCGTVISVDVDEKSEMFNHSDYCVVGDIAEIVPLVVSRLEGEK